MAAGMWVVRVRLRGVEKFPREETLINDASTVVPVFQAGDGDKRRKWLSVGMDSADERLRANYELQKLHFDVFMRGTDSHGTIIPGSETMYPLEVKGWSICDGSITSEIKVTHVKAGTIAKLRGANRPLCQLCVRGMMGTVCVFETCSDYFIIRSKIVLKHDPASTSRASAMPSDAPSAGHTRSREARGAPNIHKAKRIRATPAADAAGGKAPGVATQRGGSIAVSAASMRSYRAVSTDISSETSVTTHIQAIMSTRSVAASGTWPLPRANEWLTRWARDIYRSKLDSAEPEQLYMALLAAIMDDVLLHDGDRPRYRDTTLALLDQEILNITATAQLYLSNSHGFDPSTSGDEGHGSGSGEDDDGTPDSPSSFDVSSVFSEGATRTTGTFGPAGAGFRRNACDIQSFDDDSSYESDDGDASSVDDAGTSQAKHVQLSSRTLHSELLQTETTLQTALAAQHPPVGLFQEPTCAPSAIAFSAATSDEPARGDVLLVSNANTAVESKYSPSYLGKSESAVSGVRRIPLKAWVKWARGVHKRDTKTSSSGSLGAITISHRGNCVAETGTDMVQIAEHASAPILHAHHQHTSTIMDDLDSQDIFTKLSMPAAYKDKDAVPSALLDSFPGSIEHMAAELRQHLQTALPLVSPRFQHPSSLTPSADSEWIKSMLTPKAVAPQETSTAALNSANAWVTSSLLQPVVGTNAVVDKFADLARPLQNDSAAIWAREVITTINNIPEARRFAEHTSSERTSPIPLADKHWVMEVASWRRHAVVFDENRLKETRAELRTWNIPRVDGVRPRAWVMKVSKPITRRDGASLPYEHWCLVIKVDLPPPHNVEFATFGFGVAGNSVGEFDPWSTKVQLSNVIPDSTRPVMPKDAFQLTSCQIDAMAKVLALGNNFSLCFRNSEHVVQYVWHGNWISRQMTDPLLLEPRHGCGENLWRCFAPHMTGTDKCLANQLPAGLQMPLGDGSRVYPSESRFAFKAISSTWMDSYGCKVVLVLGLTGSGKSRLINVLANSNVCIDAASLVSKTTDIMCIKCAYIDAAGVSQSCIFIDTLGLSNTFANDAAVSTLIQQRVTCIFRRIDRVLLVTSHENPTPTEQLALNNVLQWLQYESRPEMFCFVQTQTDLLARTAPNLELAKNASRENLNAALNVLDASRHVFVGFPSNVPDGTLPGIIEQRGKLEDFILQAQPASIDLEDCVAKASSRPYAIVHQPPDGPTEVLKPADASATSVSNVAACAWNVVFLGRAYGLRCADTNKWLAVNSAGGLQFLPDGKQADAEWYMRWVSPYEYALQHAVTKRYLQRVSSWMSSYFGTYNYERADAVPASGKFICLPLWDLRSFNPWQRLNDFDCMVIDHKGRKFSFEGTFACRVAPRTPYPTITLQRIRQAPAVDNCITLSIRLVVGATLHILTATEETPSAGHPNARFDMGSPTAKFVVTRHDSFLYSFKASNNKYLRSDREGVLRADRDSVGAHERFMMVPVQPALRDSGVGADLLY